MATSQTSSAMKNLFLVFAHRFHQVPNLKSPAEATWKVLGIQTVTNILNGCYFGAVCFRHRLLLDLEFTMHTPQFRKAVMKTPPETTMIAATTVRQVTRSSCPRNR